MTAREERRGERDKKREKERKKERVREETALCEKRTSKGQENNNLFRFDSFILLYRFRAGVQLPCTYMANTFYGGRRGRRHEPV